MIPSNNSFPKINFNNLIGALAALFVIYTILKIIDHKENQISYYITPQPKKRKDFSKSTKEETKIRQGYRCNSCGQYSSLFDFHHINGDRSNNRPSNCEGLCLNCHRKIHSRK